MAEKRGGRRLPAKPASYSGVGKNSKRTDGQAIRTPNVQDGTDLTQGDEQIIRRGQQAQPLSRTPAPRIQQRPQVSPALGPSGLEEPPDFLFNMPSTRPNEDPLTDTTQSPDPDDDREFVLQVLSSAPWGNQRVEGMLDDLRRERVQAATPAETMPAAGPSVLQPEVPDGAIPTGPEELDPDAPELGAETQPSDASVVEEDFI